MTRSTIVLPVLAMALMLSGCDQFRKHPPTMGADPPLSGGEGIALVNELQSAFEVVTIVPASSGTDAAGNNVQRSDPQLCDYTRPQHQESQSRSYAKYGDDGGRRPQHFKCIRYKSATAAQARSHMEAGFALTDLYCDIYFRRISEHSNQRRFGRGLVNDVGAAITAVLGLAKASSPVVGGIGAGFGLADSSFRNYEDAFLVSADLSTLQTKVYSEQDKFREAAAKRTDVKSYAQANSLILRYANYCSYVGMRGLINASLAETTEDLPTAMERMTGYITGAIKAAKDIRAAGLPNTGDETSNETDAIDNAADAADNVADGNAATVNQM